MTRRLIREGDPPAGQLASPVPQYWNPNTEAFEDVLGAHGAPRAILYGPNGQPIGSSNPLPVADSALAQAVAQLATDGKLEEARALLETISQKDFATQTTLSEVLQRLEAIEEQLETGDAKVQLKGRIEPITFMGPTAVTGTTNSNTVDVSKYSRLVVLVNHTLNQTPSLSVWRGAYGTPYYYNAWDEEGERWWVLSERRVMVNRNRRTLLNTHPIFRALFEPVRVDRVMFRVEFADEAPSSGVIEIYGWGVI